MTTFTTKFGVGDKVWVLVQRARRCEHCDSMIGTEKEWHLADKQKDISYVSVIASNHYKADDSIYDPYYSFEMDRENPLGLDMGHIREQDMFLSYDEALAERDRRNSQK